MLEGLDGFDFEAVLSAVQKYETVTGLSAEGIEYDAAGIRIEWTYADGSWAGTTGYEMPLARILEKLDKELATMQNAMAA